MLRTHTVLCLVKHAEWGQNSEKTLPEWKELQDWKTLPLLWLQL